MKFQAPRGTHDVLPRDHLWWRVIRTIEEQCAQYGWSRVSTPGFEDTGLFERTSGEASDVVHKEMYSFVDRGDRSLTLRPEGTAPIARAYVEHGLPRSRAGEGVHDRADTATAGPAGRYREH
jgi:histidyl-tRNA synthetase